MLKKAERAIIFIDELTPLDAVVALVWVVEMMNVNKRSNQLLIEMDGFEGNEVSLLLQQQTVATS